jgi:hypothetical protein
MTFGSLPQSHRKRSKNNSGHPVGVSGRPAYGDAGGSFRGLSQAITGVAATDVLTAASFSYLADAKIRLSALTGGTGLVADTDYFVRDVVGLTFKVSLTQGGVAVNFTSDLTAGTVREIY